MNKEQAEIFVSNVNGKNAVTRKAQYEFLLCNLAILAFALAFYRGRGFIVIISTVALIYSIITMVLAKQKASFAAANILSAIHITVVCMAFNFWVYGMYQEFGGFVLWEFLASVGIQFLAFVCSFTLVIKHAEKFKPKQNFSTKEIIAITAAGFSCTLARVLCQIFSPSSELLIGMIAVLVNIIGILGSFGIAMLFYKAYLIKKYKII